jgi:outer membrane immunogenic protein
LFITFSQLGLKFPGVLKRFSGRSFLTMQVIQVMNFLLSAATLALLSGPAFAADIPVTPEPAPIMAPVPQAANWSGIYVGLHGGYGWSDVEACEDGGGCFEPDVDIEGAVFGGQIGANWQWNSFVLGAEADASWSGIDADLGDDGDRDLYDYLASARLRAGFAVDRFLAYGTGGLGITSIDYADDEDDENDNTQFGWVLGGGAEVLVTDNVTVGAEYLHYQFDNVIEELDGGEVDTDADVIRARVNVKFNGLFGG